MKVTPQITADVDEYPELRRLLNIVLRPVVDIMGAHAIASVRRMRKVGVFDHPYVKDVVSPMNITAVPRAIVASQYTVGRALLDYLEAIGMSGVTIEATAEELKGIAGLWEAPRACPAVKPAKPAEPEEPKPAAKPAERQAPEEVPGQENNNNKEEQENGEHA